MKTIRRSMILVLCLLLLTLAGCGEKKPDGKAVLTGTREKLQEASRLSFSSELSLEMDFITEEATIPVPVTGSFQTDLTEEAAYVKGTIRMEVLTDEVYQVEAYALRENGISVTYYGTDNVWIRTEDFPERVGKEVLSALLSDALSYETDAKASDKEYTILKGSLQKGEARKLLDSLLPVLSGITGAANIEEVKGEISLKLDNSALLPRGILLDFGDTLNPSAAEQEGCSIKTLTVKLTDFNITGEGEILVPEDVKKKAGEPAPPTEPETETSGETQEETQEETKEAEAEGYPIRDKITGAEGRILLPEDYVLSRYSEEDALIFDRYSEDHGENLEITYTMCPYWTDGDLAGYLEEQRESLESDEDISNLEISDLYKLSSDVGEAKCVWITYIQGEEYYEEYICFLPAGDTCLVLVDIKDITIGKAGRLLKEPMVKDVFLNGFHMSSE